MSDRKAALDMALKQIEKQFGKGSIMKLGEKTDLQISTSPSGSLALDAALGVGDTHAGVLLKFMVLNLQVKRRLPFMPSRKYKQQVDKQHSSTRSTRLTQCTHKN